MNIKSCGYLPQQGLASENLELAGWCLRILCIFGKGNYLKVFGGIPQPLDRRSHDQRLLKAASTHPPTCP